MIFLHHKNHTLQAYMTPDGQLAIHVKDILRVLCRINGAPTNVIDRMPHSDNPDDYAGALSAVFHEVKDRPETKEFFNWIHSEYAKFEGGRT